MHKVSVVILTKNSENLIVDCIESVAFCDEIIVVDDNSSDRTVDLARHLGARVEILKTGCNNFSTKRELGRQKAKGKWILYIDSDERVSADLKKSILEIISEKEPQYLVYKLNRKNFYFGDHAWPYEEQLERLFEKSALKGWRGELHESPVIEVKAGLLSGNLLHYTHRDLASMVEKTIEWSGIEAELRYKSHHPKMVWWRFPRVMLTAFFDSYIRQKGYRAGTAGVVESVYQAFSIFITYARLWELQNKKNKNIEDIK